MGLAHGLRAQLLAIEPRPPRNVMVTKLPDQPTSEVIDVGLLDFDRRNPRFPPKIAEGPTKVLLERFIRDERLLEIVDSIADSGYFPGEPLLVVPNGKRYTVVEGNRRLAALKLLVGEMKPPEGRLSIEAAIKNAHNRPDKVPCLVFKKEDQIVRYLGFRHITGIKAWSALQKARYMERLYEERYSGVDAEEGLRLLARETGSRASYLGQMLTALALYEVAESDNFFGLDVDTDAIDFSILATALSYSSIVDYLGLKSRTNASLEGLKKSNLKNLFLWLFVAKGNQKTIVGESRNLKKLAAVVSSSVAVKELLSEGRLDEAFEYSKGPGVALSEALNNAERRVTTAWQWIPKVTDLTAEHQERSENIVRVATSVRSAIQTRRDAEAVPAPISRPTTGAKRTVSKRRKV